MKVYLHMYNENIQQNSLCVESYATKEFSISLRFSPTMFNPADANSVLSRAHLCTAVDSMRRKPCLQNCSREPGGLYNGNVQQNPLCAASYVTKDIPPLPGPRLRFLVAGQIQHRTVHSFLYTPAHVDSPCRLEARFVRNKNLKKCVIYFEQSENCFAHLFVARHHLLQSMNMLLHVL